MKLLAKRRVPTLKLLPAFNNPGGTVCQCEQCTLQKFGYVMYVEKPMPVFGGFMDVSNHFLDQSISRDMKRAQMWNREQMLHYRMMSHGFPVASYGLALIQPRMIIYPTVL